MNFSVSWLYCVSPGDIMPDHILLFDCWNWSTNCTPSYKFILFHHSFFFDSINRLKSVAVKLCDSKRFWWPAIFLHPFSARRMKKHEPIQNTTWKRKWSGRCSYKPDEYTAYALGCLHQQMSLSLHALSYWVDRYHTRPMARDRSSCSLLTMWR